MGLDVYAYGGLTKVENCALPGDAADEPSRYGMVRIHKTEFDRAPELEDGGLYRPKVVESYHFSAGSYGGYNDWRDWLAKLVGFGSAKDVWRDPKPGSFVELINFSDCEGTIGVEVSKKLAKDFAEWENRARDKASSSPSPWYFELYMRFKRAFEVASNDGVVVFG